MSVIPALNMPFVAGRVVLKRDRNQCQGCKAYFNSTYAFDAHRTGKYGLTFGHPEGRRCLTEAQMLAKGMGVNHWGFWVSKRKLLEAA